MSKTRSVHDMPVRGGKQAPRTFKDYDALLSFNQVIETLSDYKTPNWDNLKAEILKIYDSERNERRFKHTDLKDFCCTAHHSSIHSLSTRIAGWLKEKNMIDEDTYNKAFWKGLPRTLRPRIESRVLRINPAHDLTKPFTVANMLKSLEDMFRRDRFDADESESDSDHDQDQSDSEDGTDSDSDSAESENSDDEFSRYKKSSKKQPKKTSRSEDKSGKIKRKKKRKIESGHKAHVRLRALQDEETAAEEFDEVETIIRKLQTLSLDDPNYSTLFYRAYKLDKDIVQIVQCPRRLGESTSSPIVHSGGPPATMADNRPLSRGEMTCYGCGKKGHSMNYCPEIIDLLNKGTIKRDINGKLTMPDDALPSPPREHARSALKACSLLPSLVGLEDLMTKLTKPKQISLKWTNPRNPAQLLFSPLSLIPKMMMLLSKMKPRRS
ncbi:hypothetical protein BKA93DRAFT_814325 [Sparassis latifolia]